MPCVAWPRNGACRRIGSSSSCCTASGAIFSGSWWPMATGSACTSPTAPSGIRTSCGASPSAPPMSANKRPSTSSLRRFITTRPYVAIAELRRRFGLDDPDAMSLLERNGQMVWIGLPEREATKLQDLWLRDEIGMELSVEVRAPVVVGIYPMRIARYMMDGAPGNGSNGFHPPLVHR